eukprot:1158798-Pelagomonas_calceolata.AAC.5
MGKNRGWQGLRVTPTPTPTPTPPNTEVKDAPNGAASLLKINTSPARPTLACMPLQLLRPED